MQQHPDAAVRVFVVWEPIQPMDWAPPVNAVLRRVPDRRAQQYWDPDHVVAKQLARDARPPQPVPDCCDKSGILWDLAAVYAKGVTWTDRMPPAVVFNGPVVDVVQSIEAVIAGKIAERGLSPFRQRRIEMVAVPFPLKP